MSAPRRIQLSRAAGWRKPEGAVVVSRPSIFGNPWKPGRPGTFWLPDWPVANPTLEGPLSVGAAVRQYRRLIEQPGGSISASFLPKGLNERGRRVCRDMLRSHARLILANLPDLRDRDLLCWCKPGEPCHADVLLELANR